MSHIESGGLSLRDILNILHNLKGNIVDGDVVEYNPQRDATNNMTALVTAKLVRELATRCPNDESSVSFNFYYVLFEALIKQLVCTCPLGFT